MLALRQILKSDGSYLDLNHPVQMAVIDCIESMLGYKRAWSWGIDGCSLPTPAVSLKELATLFAMLASGRSLHDERYDHHLSLIYEAMSSYPHLVGGTARFDSAFMKAAQGAAVCKVGGEGIRGFAIRDTEGQAYGVVVKVVDGALRALHPACMEFLHRLELIDRPEPIDQPFSQLGEVDRFWRGVELNAAGLEVTEIRIR